MLTNINFYTFMHKQLLVAIALFVSTGLGYIYMGYHYGSIVAESIWYGAVLTLSLWAYHLYRSFDDNDLNINEKDRWLLEVNYFFYTYFSLWTVMFVVYTLRSNIELHYIVLATQLGASVVAATILVSQRRLANVTLISLMTPLFLYFILINEFYSYLLAFFTVVLTWVLSYASKNTYNYLVKNQFRAYHDYLTALGNRHYFIQLLEDAIKTQKRDKKDIYLLLVDLDHFKTINDSLGHDVGDILLKEASQRMVKVAEKYGNSVSRLGGDEFCILSQSNENRQECRDEALHFAKELLEVIKKSYVIEGHNLYISASIGVSLINNPKMEAGVFLKEADIAMYEAKSHGRDGIIIFNEALALRVNQKLEIERLLHFALEKKEISLSYQPQMNSSGNIVGCEVLVRWHNDILGTVGPDVFIPIAEQTGFIIELGYYILEESLKTLQAWDQKAMPLEKLSINISMRQLLYDSFVQDVKNLTEKYLTPNLCSKVVFELTETSFAEDRSQLIANMKSIKEFGITFSMDDFGTGYSSLSYLQDIPVDEIKIDRSFISHIDVKSDTRLVKTILNISKNFDLRVVAEGVETEYQKEFLIENRCDILQGYYFFKPLVKEDFEALLFQ